MADQRLETVLQQLEATANNFAVRLVRPAQVRAAYVQQIREMSRSIRSAVETGDLFAGRGAEIANQMRNQIMDMQRARDFDLGCSLAQRMKGRGGLEESITRAMKKLNLEGKPFNQLSGQQQHQVFVEVIDSAGRSRPAVTQKIPRLRWLEGGYGWQHWRLLHITSEQLKTRGGKWGERRRTSPEDLAAALPEGRQWERLAACGQDPLVWPSVS
jgi:hypothetical protein